MAMFLLVTLPKVWDTFCATISNLAPMDGLTCVDVESIFLTKEVNWKNVQIRALLH